MRRAQIGRYLLRKSALAQGIPQAEFYLINMRRNSMADVFSALQARHPFFSQ